MAESNFDMSDFISAFKNLKMPDYSSIIPPPKIHTVEIDEKSTFAYQMQQQTNQIVEKSNEQINILIQQNEQLINNYRKLEELYSLKEAELKEAETETKKAKRYNIIMLGIALAAWLLPDPLWIINLIKSLF